MPNKTAEDGFCWSRTFPCARMAQRVGESRRQARQPTSPNTTNVGMKTSERIEGRSAKRHTKSSNRRLVREDMRPNRAALSGPLSRSAYAGRSPPKRRPSTSTPSTSGNGL
jgi:hypothetical protein